MEYFYTGTEFAIGLEDELLEYRKKAQSRRTLNHYTDIESFFKIIENKSLKLNAIDNLNDRMEAEYLEDPKLNKLIFVSSFCHGSENIPLWHMYTNRNYGLNIEFDYQSFDKEFIEAIYDNSRWIEAFQRKNVNEPDNFNRQGFLLDDLKPYSGWSIELRVMDVCYSSDIKKENPVVYEGVFKYDLNAMGVFKSEFWQHEEETRLIGQLRTAAENIPVLTYDYILIPITFKNTNLTIRFSPWMSEEIKECVKLKVEKYLPEVKVNYVDSQFTDQVIRKY